MWGEVGIQCARRPALENPMKTRVSALPRAEFDWKLRVCAQRVFTSTNFSCAIFCWRTSSRLAVHNDNNSRSVERCSGSVSRMRTQTLHTLNTKTQNTPHGNYHTCLYHSQYRFIRILRLWGKGICKGHWGDVLRQRFRPSLGRSIAIQRGKADMGTFAPAAKYIITFY